MSFNLSFLQWILLLGLTQCNAFIRNPIATNTQHNIATPFQKRRNNNIPTTTELKDVNEWRDTFFNIDDNDDDGTSSSSTTISTNGVMKRPINVLPFPFDDVLLQGETKQLRLYEDRFIKLFNDCMDNLSGVVAMGLIANSGIIQICPLCEIEAYQKMDDFGIFVTIRVVGRVRLVELKDQEPYIKAICKEINDEIPSTSPTSSDRTTSPLELPNLIASNIENMIVTLSSLENQLYNLEKKKQGDEEGKLDGAVSSSSEMSRRILEAKLEDKFYDEQNLVDEEEDDDYDIDDDDEDDFMDTNAQFKEAFQNAKASDTQGYMISSSPTEQLELDEKTGGTQRNAQDLTAISWAVFCVDNLDVTSRIQALDSTSLLDRLKLGSYVLRQKNQALLKELDEFPQAEEEKKEEGDSKNKNTDEDEDNML